MKKQLSLVVASILISTSAYAMSGITKDTKTSTSIENSGSKTLYKAKKLSMSRNWSKTISKNNFKKQRL